MFIPVFAAAESPNSLSTIISLISLLVAAGTFFLTQLRSARVTSYLGPIANFGYRATDGGLSITVPVTFTNRGSRTGAVLRSAIVLWRKDWPEERYFMQWNSFVKEDFKTLQWANDEVAHALAIPGKSIVAKVISFAWLDASKPILFRDATYCLAFLYWAKEGRPNHEIHEIPITADMVATLNTPFDSTHLRAVGVALDKKYKVNESLNTSAYEYRLEGK
jgi:hypothetical protein